MMDTASDGEAAAAPGGAPRERGCRLAGRRLFAGLQNRMPQLQ